MAKIHHPAQPRNHDYLLEQSRQAYQERLTGLLELHSTLTARCGKKGLWLEREQTDTITKWLLEIVAGMSGDYDVLQRTNRWMARRIDHLEHCVRMYRAMRQLNEYPFISETNDGITTKS